MTQPAALASVVRRSYRRYRYGPLRFGHPLLRRAFALFLADTQFVELRCGLHLRLDLSRDNQNTLFWLDGDVEPQLSWLIRTLLPVGGVFVDCGANVGLMGLLARQYRGARVVFLEPHPRLAESISQNIRLNQFETACTLVEAAASDRNGESVYFEHRHADGSHSLLESWGGGDSRPLGKVRLTTLAQVVAQMHLPAIDVLKIDTEGHDLAVLHGLGDLLTPAFTRLLYVEMSIDRPSIVSLLRDRGYSGFNTIKLSRHTETRRLQAFEAGASVAYFAPVDDQIPSQGEMLWCAPDSPVAAFLNWLAALRT